MLESRALDYIYDTTFTTPFQDNNYFRKLPNRANTSSDTIAYDGIGGQNVLKFLKRPNVPVQSILLPNLYLSSSPYVEKVAPSSPIEEPRVRDAETQTLYRESESQTDPYAPDFSVSNEKPKPDILLMLNRKIGIPGSEREVAYLENARIKRRVEDSLPPFTDEASLTLRKKLMADQELQEAKIKDAEFDEFAQQRIEQLAFALSKRDEDSQYRIDQQIQAFRESKENECKSIKNEMRSEQIKTLRKLEKARAAMKDCIFNGRLKKQRDFIKEYGDYGSEVYAPLQRQGCRVDRDGEKFDVFTKASPLKTYKAVKELEPKIPVSMFRLPYDARNKNSTQSASRSRKAKREEAAIASDLKLLEEIYHLRLQMSDTINLEEKNFDSTFSQGSSDLNYSVVADANFKGE